MSRVTIRCPTTGDELATDIEIDEKSFRTAAFDDRQIKCRACNVWHPWATSDAFLR
jgi:hypothetical protein